MQTTNQRQNIERRTAPTVLEIINYSQSVTPRMHVTAKQMFHK